jgi:hypothetical protein
MIRALRAQDMTSADIAGALNDAGLKRPSNTRWTAVSVRVAIHNDVVKSSEPSVNTG